MDKQAAIQMLARYRAGNCTAEERQLVEHWVLYGAGEPLDLSDDQLLEDLLDIRLRLERDLHKESRPRTFGLRRWLPYAAALLAVSMIAVWALRDHLSIGQKTEALNLSLVNVQPGGNRATLTLADGQTIALSAAQSGIIVGDEIRYTDGSEVVSQEPGALESHLRPADIQLLTLTTPKGGIYQITLPDGSKAWLNSDSKLTYPSRFADDGRVVELEGEAYFEVSKMFNTGLSENRTSKNLITDRLPFIVKTRNQTVEVLGTQFNISAYGDEPEVKTTLVEGSVKVALVNRTLNEPTSLFLEQAQSTILKPGQQSIVRNEKTMISDVDVSSFIGWKEGYFIFNGTELRDAMRQLSRWYDVEIIYQGTIPETPFHGKISRDDTLADVLSILEEGKVNFRIEKQGGINRLIVMP